MRRNAVRIAVLAMTGLALRAGHAMAQGYGVYEHDACTMGRAGTGVAKPCNASAVFYNPAGIVQAGGTRWNVSVGGVLIRPSFTFTDSVTGAATTGPANTIPVPHVFITRQFAHGWAAGFGIFAPYGLISEWPTTFSGRFLGYRSELKTIYFQPTIAKQVNSWLQIGAGFDYIRTTVDLKQRVDLSSQVAAAGGVTFGNLGIPLGTDFADAHVTGGSWSGTGHFGVIIKPMRRITIGARYLMRSTGDIQGDAAFTQLPTGILLPAGSPLQPGVNGIRCSGHVPIDTLRAAVGLELDQVLECNNVFGTTLAKQHASTRVPLPDQFVIGVAINVTSQLTVLGDYQRVDWHKFISLPLNFATIGSRTLWEDFTSTDGLRVGAQFDVNSSVSVRGGMLWHQGAAPDNTVTPLLPEGERVEQTLGLSLKIMSNARIDAAYQHITQADRRGRVVDAARGAGASLNSGLYSGGANLFGVSLAWGF